MGRKHQRYPRRARAFGQLMSKGFWQLPSVLRTVFLELRSYLALQCVIVIFLVIYLFHLLISYLLAVLCLPILSFSLGLVIFILFHHFPVLFFDNLFFKRIPQSTKLLDVKFGKYLLSVISVHFFFVLVFHSFLVDVPFYQLINLILFRIIEISFMPLFLNFLGLCYILIVLIIINGCLLLCNCCYKSTFSRTPAKVNCIIPNDLFDIVLCLLPSFGLS